MKKIVQINTFSYKATGNIMMSIHKMLLEAGYDSYVVWGRGRNADNDHEFNIYDFYGVNFHGIYTRLTDRTGFASWHATKKLINILNEIQPEIIHLHNLHGYYVNIEMLFQYIKEKNIKIVWTLHDCWPITGHCAYFDMCGCEKWKTGCRHCEQKTTYPTSNFLDSCEWNWNKKKTLFEGIDCTIVTPSQWLEKIVKKSFLKSCPIKVINNGIDTNIFKPIYREKIKNKYSPEDKPIVLGVASEWTERKGLADFVRLSEISKKYQIVLVGLEQNQIKKLPDNIIGITRTNNIEELVELYSIADVFFNPTYEDNFPTTNIEALACGIPVITYDTGGSPEIIEYASTSLGESVGAIVNKENSKMVDIYKVIREIGRIVEKKERRIYSQSCREVAKRYDRRIILKKYLEVYKTLDL